MFLFGFGLPVGFVLHLRSVCVFLILVAGVFDGFRFRTWLFCWFILLGGFALWFGLLWFVLVLVCLLLVFAATLSACFVVVFSGVSVCVSVCVFCVVFGFDF